MSRRLLGVWLSLAPFALGAFASTATASVRVSISPSAGKPTTTFVVRFRAPSATSTALHRHYELYASGARATRCTSSITMALGATSQGSQVRAAIRPKGRHGSWCAGKFSGRIVEYFTIPCVPIQPIAQIVCPEIVIAPQTIARFSFRVKQATSSTSGKGTQTTAPTFAGLQSASTCAGIPPKALPAQRIYTLTWRAASDPVTPSSKIVYEIFYSPSSGAEDYASPTWTTPAGVTQYDVTIPDNSAAYFVVRARDSAGLEDHNTVQLLGLDACPA
jgi:hypothetical protein